MSSHRDNGAKLPRDRESRLVDYDEPVQTAREVEPPRHRPQPSGSARDFRRAPATENYDDHFVDEEPSVGRQLSLRDIYFMVRERWMLGLAVGILLAGGVAYWMLTRPAIYEGTAQILVELSPDKVGIIDSLEKEEGKDLDQAMEIHVRRIQSASYRAKVLEHLSEADRKSYIDGLVKSEKPDHILTTEERDELFTRHFEGVGEKRAPNLHVDKGRKSQFITVSYRHPEPAVAQKMANLFSESYNPYLQTESRLQQMENMTLLTDQMEEKKVAIQQAEKEIIEHKRRHKIVDDPEGEGSREGAALLSLSEQVAKAKEEQRELQLKRSHLDEIDQTDALELIALPFIAEFGTGPDLQLKLQEIQLEFSQLDLKYGARHPKVIENRGQLQKVLDQILTNAKLAIRNIDDSLEAASRRLEKLESSVAEAENEKINAGDPLVALRVMEANLETERQDYRTFLESYNSIQFATEMDTTRVKVTEPAILPLDPVIPNHLKTAAFSGLIFFGCLFGLPVGIGFLDTRIKSFSEAEAYLGKEGLSVVPERRKMEHQELGQCVLKDLDFEVVESFRVLYSSVLLKSKVAMPKVIVTTSTGPGEGKSFITANLAAMFGRHQNRVVVIDCDLRKPSQHRIQGLKNREGVLNWYEKDRSIPSDLDELRANEALGMVALSDDGLVNLIRAGGSTRNPSEVISSRDFERLVNSLRNMFDIVFLDSPPVGLFSDALLLTHYADESLFVCKHNGLNRHKIKFALTKMEDSHCPVLGTVMNQLSASRRHQYGYSYRDYGYGAYSSKDYAAYYHDEKDDD